MRKLLMLVVILVMAVAAMAQSTNKISYQAVLRDSHNRLVTNKDVSVTVTITYGNNTYTENLNGTTNANGLLSLEIGGENGFDAIDWRNALITTSTVIDNETVTDQVHVTAVPFALTANNAAEISPNASTITAIYNNLTSLDTRMVNDSTNLVNFKNKVHGDSLALGALIDANADAINNLSANVDNKTAVLSNRIATDSTNLVNFKNKVHGDSLALGALIDANAAAINNLSANVDNKTAALSNRIAADSTNLVNFKNKVHGDSLALGALIDANADAINNLSTNVDNKTVALSNRIAADSTNLVNFQAKVKADSIALAGQIKTLANSVDNKTAALSNRIAADSTNLVNFQTKVKADSITLRGLIKDNTDNITTTTTNLAALQNRVNIFNTNVCDSVNACVKVIVHDTANVMREEIKNTIDNLANYYTKTQTDINIHDTANVMREEMDTKLAGKANSADVYTRNEVYTKAEVDALLNELRQSMPVMAQDSFTVAQAGQTSFTLKNVPHADHVLRMYINGVMVGGNHSGVLTTTNDPTSKVVEYNANQNKNRNGDAYHLKAGDKVTIVYWYVKPATATTSGN